ncbi:unnamed protein product [Protopolystoma xenopodis]|uniref:Uncharacterized protein n=1 Tax=Protopolystoma xenopodis TaxID=117903 RepID=A0A448X3V3_9PLAT|nr:unnamed protein product [Protopolystoma xenopodis]
MSAQAATLSLTAVLSASITGGQMRQPPHGASSAGLGTGAPGGPGCSGQRTSSLFAGLSGTIPNGGSGGGGCGLALGAGAGSGVQMIGGHRSDTETDFAPPPKKIYTNDIPVLDTFPGYYGFSLYHLLCEEAYEGQETKPSTAFFVSYDPFTTR